MERKLSMKSLYYRGALCGCVGASFHDVPTDSEASSSLKFGIRAVAGARECDQHIVGAQGN